MPKTSPIGTININKQTIKVNDGSLKVGSDVYQLIEGRDQIEVAKKKLAAVIPAIGKQPNRAIDADLKALEIDNLFANEGSARQRASFLNNTLEINNGERVKEADIGWLINAAGPKAVVFYRRKGIWRTVSPECCSFKKTANGVKVIAPSGQGRGGGHIVRNNRYTTDSNYHAENIYRTLKEASDNHAGIVAAAVRNGQVQGMMAFAAGSVADFASRKLTWRDWVKVQRQWSKVFG